MRSDGYSILSILVHWLTAGLVVALFVTHESARGSAGFAFHVGGGAIAGVFLLWRVWYRLRRGATDEPEQARALVLLAHLVRWGLLLAIVVVVVTGYLLPWSVGQAIDVYGIVQLPSPLPTNRDFHEAMEAVHDLAGHLFLPLLALHILGALKHRFIDRDGVMTRIVRPLEGGR